MKPDCNDDLRQGNDDLLGWLQHWYVGQCDDEWEHGYGVQITTLDNPGWMIKVSVKGTRWETKEFPRSSFRLDSDDDDNDWYTVWKEGTDFHGAGGPFHLQSLLKEFRKFVSD